MDKNTGKEFVNLLHDALEKEYNDAFLYLKEAEIFKKKIVGGDKLSIVFENFSKEEFRHADRVAMKIIELGSKADYNFRPVAIEPSLRDTLRSHTEKETQAYFVYGRLIELCDDTDFNIILKGIRENEKEHLDKITHILKKLK
ncbi:MAG: ferritin-like domain-containing protein [Elusimicrobia bacterium]|nr:ferritin-like domain-containing protein [Candidatus Liberimonas magnetica]